MCNFPQTDIAVALMKMVLGWPDNRDEVFAVLDPVIEQATAADGITREKGLNRANDNSTDGLPYDIFADDPAAIQQGVAEVIAREGMVSKVGSVNKQQWHLAILRSGQGVDARAAWISYDRRLGHGHSDGMNLGLFAKGLDLMPDFGYPPVQYGGWNSSQATWYKMSAAHNTVVVDGQNQSEADGTTTLWADGEQFRAIRLSGPDLIRGQQFERTVAMIDVSDRDDYLVDIFRVVGGTDHAKFMHSHFGRITTQGLSLTPADAYGYDTQMPTSPWISHLGQDGALIGRLMIATSLLHRVQTSICGTPI